MIKVVDATTAEQLDAVRQLCWAYRDFLLTFDAENARIIRTFYPHEVYADLMENLTRDSAPPNGSVKLALKDGEPVGCGMSRTLEPGVAEIKRVYVTDSARGTGAGRAIMTALIDQCRADGFKVIRMDTGKPLKAATQLYLSLGFELRGPYYDVPEIADGLLLFFELRL